MRREAYGVSDAHRLTEYLFVSRAEPEPVGISHSEKPPWLHAQCWEPMRVSAELSRAHTWGSGHHPRAALGRKPRAGWPWGAHGCHSLLMRSAARKALGTADKPSVSAPAVPV